MPNISDFFSRIRNSYAKEILVRTAICDSMRMVAGIEVPVEAITIRSGTITLKGVNQADRSTIFIKKQAILDDIRSRQAVRTISDIR